MRLDANGIIGFYGMNRARRYRNFNTKFPFAATERVCAANLVVRPRFHQIDESRGNSGFSVIEAMGVVVLDVDRDFAEAQDVIESIYGCGNTRRPPLEAGPCLQGGERPSRRERQSIGLRLSNQLALNRKVSQLLSQSSEMFHQKFMAQSFRGENIASEASFFKCIAPAKPQTREPIGLSDACLALKRANARRLSTAGVGQTLDFRKDAALSRVHLFDR